MADAIPHELNEANGLIKNSGGAGKVLPIDRFLDKSLIFIIGGSGSYDVQVSNTGGPDAEWVTIASALVAGGSPVLITTEDGASPRMPRKVAFLRVFTNTFNSGDKANFLGEDPH